MQYVNSDTITLIILQIITITTIFFFCEKIGYCFPFSILINFHYLKNWEKMKKTKKIYPEVRHLSYSTIFSLWNATKNITFLSVFNEILAHEFFSMTQKIWNVFKASSKKGLISTIELLLELSLLHVIMLLQFPSFSVCFKNWKMESFTRSTSIC